MGETIQVKRGNSSNIPNLLNGEFGLATNQKDVYIGTPDGNQLVGGASVNAQLAEKAEKTDLDLKRDKGILIGLTDFSDDAKQAIAGTASIYPSFADESVTTRKTSFIRSKNIFDKNASVSGYLSNVNGTVLADSNYRTTDYMKVKQGDIIYSKNNIGGYAFYGYDFTFISGANGQVMNQLTVPTNAEYVRTYMSASVIDINMLTKNEPIPSDYVSYEMLLDNAYIKKLTRENISKIDAQLSDLLFATTKNLFDKSKVTSGQYIDPATGGLLSAGTLFTSDYIPVQAGAIYTASSMRTAAFYDANKTFISGLNDSGNPTPYTFTVPANAVYIRISASTTKVIADNFQIESGNRVTEYESYGHKINTTDIRENKNYGLNVNLPNNLYLVNGKSLNVYFDNIIHDVKRFNVDVVSTKGIHYDKRLGLTADFTGDHSVTFEVYDGQRFIASKVVTVKSVGTTNGTGTKKCLFIGDSTTSAGKYTQSLLDSFVGDSMGVQLLGTRGTAPNLHEGRSGWSSNEYTKLASLGGVANPFWNPNTSAFDFSYYMTQQGYSSLDYVFIHLGINDIFNYKTVDEAKVGIPTLLTQFDAMINSIKAFSSTIKIGVMVTIPPNVSQTAFGSAYGTGQTRWRYIAVYHEWLKQLIAKYDSRQAESLYLVPIHTNLDTEVHISDAVHPTDPGYIEMAEPIYYFLKNVT